MITILYDTKDERENLEDFFLRGIGCIDFSDMVPISDCEDPESCARCRARLIENCLQDRAEYQKLNPFIKDQPESCSTCANAPICWLSTTAAAPAPCAHYIPDRRNTTNEGK